jgi:hypothetical protein
MNLVSNDEKLVPRKKLLLKNKDILMENLSNEESNSPTHRLPQNLV